MHQYFKYAVAAALVWRLTWLLIYYLTGFYISYISINNGVSFNGITYHGKVHFSLSSLRFRLWGNTRRIILSNLSISVPSTRKRSKSKKASTATDSPLSIYPNSILLKPVMKLGLYLLSHIDVELRNVSVLASLYQVSLDSVQIVLKSKQKIHSTNSCTLSLVNSVTKASIQIQDPEAPSTPVAVGFLSLSLKLSIDTKSGRLSNVSTRLYVDDLIFKTFSLIKSFISSGGTDEPKAVHHKDHKSIPQETLESKIDNYIQVHNRIFRCFNEISLHVANFNIEKIPLFSPSSNHTLEEYFALKSISSSIFMSVESISINLARVLDTSAGYEVLFNNPRDSPFELTVSTLLFKLGYRDEASSGLGKQEEFLSIPSYSLTLKTNIIDHLVHGYGFKNCVLELFSSGNSPMLDVDVRLLALLWYNYLVLKKLMRLRKLQKNESAWNPRPCGDFSESESDGEDSTDSEGTAFDESNEQHIYMQIVDRAMSLLEDYYPRIDIKLTVEQPRALLRLHNERENKTQMLMVSYSMMVMHVMTTEDHDYDSMCHFMHPSVTFSEKSVKDSQQKVFTEEFCGLGDAYIRFQVLKYLKLQAVVSLSGAFVKLVKPDVLNGINSIINSATRTTTESVKRGRLNRNLDAQILNELAKMSPKKATPSKPFNPEDIIFASLPVWFISTEFKFDGLTVKLGSTSPLLPPSYISELSKKSMAIFTETSSILTFKIGEFKLLVENVEEKSTFEESNQIMYNAPSESSPVETKDFFWDLTFQIRDTSLSTSDTRKKVTILKIPEMSFAIRSQNKDSKNELVFDSNMERLEFFIDKQVVFNAVGSVHLIRETIIKPIKKLQSSFTREQRILRSTSKKRLSFKLQDYLVIKFSLQRINIILALSEQIRVRIQSYDLKMSYAKHLAHCSNLLTRAMVSSPTVSGYWDRVLVVDSISARFNSLSPGDSIIIETSAIRICQPHKFVVYKLFDNLSIFMKVLKHLIKCLKNSEVDMIVRPTESKPIALPPIRLKSKKITFAIEDDPFESDLNMIYQLGLIEQRKRIELQESFDEKVKLSNENLDQEEIDEKQSALNQVFEGSWIRKVNAYKSKLSQECDSNKLFLFGEESNLSNDDNLHINAYSISAPLLSVILTGVNLQISQPKFPLDHLPQFIYDNGQGVPKDTRYNLMIPMFMNVSIEELRMHLRDYPLPLFELPYSIDSSGKGRALLMSGHLVLAENLVLAAEHLRKLPVQLVEATDDPEYQPNHFDKLIIQKSMAVLKIYTDMDVLFDSSEPSRFIWGQSYQFGIQQVMLNVDQFSKPPVDPSSKLGFWDKLRYVMHGHMNIRTGKHASIEVGFKGDKDPYNLFGHANGFILSMRDSVEWKINEYDNSLKFFDIQAGKISWYIPNYLSSPLVCWTRPSSQPTFFPKMKDVVSSCHGYYLNDMARIDDISKSSEVLRSIPEKEVVQLSGGVTLNVGFLLQRKMPGSDEMSEKGKCHYEIELFNPKYTKEGHDSYEGFRTGRIHMALSFVAHTDTSYNTIHLSPGVFNHFFDWWSLFKGNTMLPIRKGSLFGEVKNAEKFSEHLFTNKFLFDIKNLFISHIYRNEDFESDSDELECIGLRAKVDEFVVDLHQKKEEVFDSSDNASRGKKVMKMMFNLGQVVLTKIDLRTVQAIFHRNIYTAVQREKVRAPKDSLKVFDNNSTWLDLEDFDEAFFPSNGFILKCGEILPFLYAEKFAYIRDISGDRFEEDLSNDHTHECTMYKTDYYSSQIEVYKRRLEDIRSLSKSEKILSKQNVEKRISTLKSLIEGLKSQRKRSMHKGSVDSTCSEHRENFHNKFILVSMFLKWNESVRNQFMKYIHFVQRSSSYKKLMSFEFMSMLENIIEREKNRDAISTLKSTLEEAENAPEILRSRLNKSESSQERIDNFDRILRDVTGDNAINEDYKIEVISPQIQLQSEQAKDSVVIITAPVLESKILSVKAHKDSAASAQELERRYGVLLHDASVMIVEKSSMRAKQIALEKQPYGTKSKWPPFLGIETCKSSTLAFEEDVLVNRMSFMLTFDQVMASVSKMEQTEIEDNAKPDNHSKDSKTANRLRVDVPRLAINSTSKQYFSLYVTVISLFLYAEPLAVELSDRISKLRFSNDFQDLPALYNRLKSLHKIVGISGGILENYNFRQDGYLSNEALNEYLLLTHTKMSLSDVIILTLQTLFSGELVTTSSARVIQDWRIAADEIVLHMLNDDRSPIVDLKIEHGVCKRVLKDDGSNNNRIEIRSIEGVTLLKNAFYKKFLAPLKETNAHDLITVDWSMNRSVGGIKIIDIFDISSLPLNLSIDEETGSSLMKFIFQTDTEITQSPILKISEKDSEESEDKGSESDGHSEADSDLASRSQKRSLATSKSNKNSSSKDSGSSASSGNDLDHDRDVIAMIDRSKKYISISKLTSQSFEVMISLRMKTGSKRLLNVSNFRLQLPTWEIETKVLSLLDVVDIFKKTAIKALLSHSGGLLKNKMSSRKQNLKRFERRFSSKKKVCDASAELSSENATSGADDSDVSTG